MTPIAFRHMFDAAIVCNKFLKCEKKKTAPVISYWISQNENNGKWLVKIQAQKICFSIFSGNLSETVFFPDKQLVLK